MSVADKLLEVVTDFVKKPIDSKRKAANYPGEPAARVRGTIIPTTTMQQQTPLRGEFTILRSAEQLFSGSEKPLRVTIQPTPIKLLNARGRLRLVDSSDIRKLASDSAGRIINALSKRKV